MSATFRPTRSTLAPPLTGLTCGLQVIEGLHQARWSPGPCRRTLPRPWPTAGSSSMVLAFSEWWRNSIRERTVVGQGEGAGRGAFLWPAAEPDRATAEVNPGGTVEGSEPAGTGQAPAGQLSDYRTGGQVGVGRKSHPVRGAWPVGSLTNYHRGQRRDKVLQEDSTSQRIELGQNRARTGGQHIGRPLALILEQDKQCRGGSEE